MLITYTRNRDLDGRNEILVTTRKHERETLEVWFSPKTGRDLDEYDRYEHEGTPCVSVMSDSPMY